MIDESKAIVIQGEPAPCRECKGTGRVQIVGRDKTFRDGKPDVLDLRCPVCGGTGKAGLRKK